MARKNKKNPVFEWLAWITVGIFALTIIFITYDVISTNKWLFLAITGSLTLVFVLTNVISRKSVKKFLKSRFRVKK